ncbi:MAG: phosphoribosylanthranilate isomerase [Deltaproteobacteria bacterium]|nr:phosphoribosylanthranilate isomerase [Deltaproteobacteria bacterium]
MNAPLVKICGLTTIEDTLAAIEMGADWLGFNFYSESPRFLSYENALQIFQEIPSSIPKVGVFVNEERELVLDLACQLELDYLQFHGDESPEYCNAIGRDWFKACRLMEESALEHIPEYDCDFLLVDAGVNGQYGGTGEQADWDLARRSKNFGKKIILAGGLTPSNVQVAIATVQPFGVDVASGVEKKPGVKDHRKMEDFINKAKSVSLRVLS